MDSLLAMIEQQRIAFETRLQYVSAKEIALAVWETELKKRSEALDDRERRAWRNCVAEESSAQPMDLPWRERLSLAHRQLAKERSSQHGPVFPSGFPEYA
jgi:hypothetical protein